MDKLEWSFVGFICCTILFVLFIAYLPLPQSAYENEQEVITHLEYPIIPSDNVPEGQTVQLKEFSDFVLFLEKEEPTTVHFVAFKPAVPFWASTYPTLYFVSDKGIIYIYR